MANQAPAIDRYTQTMRSYCKHLAEKGSITLIAYCRIKHVHYNGMLKWMSHNNLTVKSVKSDLLAKKLAKATQTENSFLRLTPQNPISSTLAAAENSPLQGVSFTFSDGTTLRIDKGNPEAIVLLVVMYKKEAALCLG
jgi:hypothetical protein